MHAPSVYSSTPVDLQVLAALAQRCRNGCLSLEEPFILFCVFLVDCLLSCLGFFKPQWKNTFTVSLWDHSPVRLWNGFIIGSQETIRCTGDRKSYMQPLFRYSCEGFSARGLYEYCLKTHTLLIIQWRDSFCQPQNFCHLSFSWACLGCGSVSSPKLSR